MGRMESIIFTGDIGFDKYMYGKWDDPDLISKEVLEFLSGADHVVTNVEGPIVDNTRNDSSTGAAQLIHAISPEAVKVLLQMKSDIWNINNNHIMDAGAKGIESTISIAKENGIKTIGAGMNFDEAKRPIILDSAGGIGMLSVGYQRACRPATAERAGCYSWSELDSIRDTIARIKKTCRWCIVIAHAGEEFTSLPSPYTRDRFHLYLEMGADIVVCHHPHVPMNYETVGDKVIFYSLGNFIFDTDYQRSQHNTDIGLLIKLNFTEEAFSFEPFGLKIQRGPEHIVKSELPDIFQDVPEEEYNLLLPLSSKLLVEATKRQQKYLNPAKFSNATDEQWQEHFTEPLRTGRVPGETLDFAIILPLSEKEKEKAWEHSKLDKVKRYILDQFKDV